MGSTLAFAQDNTIPSNSTVTDTTAIKYKNSYGLRVGVDLFRPARSFFDDEFNGFEINADFRLKKNLYISGEVGNDERTTITDFLNSTAEGNYIKAGVDFNLYSNWLGEDNLIYAGFRLGYSSFTQTLNSFTVFNTDQSFPQGTFDDPIEFDDLDAIWGEFIFGVKTEVFNNFYIGANIQLKLLASETEPDNFRNLYIPGFNRTSENSSFGFGFGYTMSYLISFKKK